MKPMQAQRRMMLAQYGHLYFRHLDAGADLCFYCGERRECLDHRPPIDSLAANGPQSLREARIPMVLLPCCRDCNQRLGSRPLLTALEACTYLRETLEQAYEKGTTLWSEEDEKPMSPMFRKLIKARRQAAQQLVSRVRFLQQREIEHELMPTYFALDDSE